MRASAAIRSLLVFVLAGAASAGLAAHPVQQSGGGQLTAAELSVWSDPAFKKRFAESYLAETEVEPRLTESEREDLMEVMDLIVLEQLGEANEMLVEMREDGSSAVVDFMLGNIHFQREEYDAAAQDYETAVEKYPKFLRAWRHLGKIYMRDADYEKALPALTRVVELGGNDGLTYGLLGIAYANTGKYLAAESAFRMANLLQPDSVDWKMGMAESFFKQRRFAEAAALAGALIDEQPDNPRFWLIQANAYVGQEKPMKAAENFEMVDRLNASTPATLNMLGDIYATEEMYDLAVTSFLRAMQMDPENKPDRALRAAKYLAAAGALGEARTLIEGIESAKGAQLAADDRKDILKIRARLAVQEGAGEEQARVLEEIVAMDPLDGEALLLLGKHYRLAGDGEKAIFYFERAANIREFEADALVGQAQVLVGQGSHSSALPLLRKAQKLDYREHVQRYLDQVERIATNRS